MTKFDQFWNKTIAQFEKLHLTSAGRYIGPSWHKLFRESDWPYDYGQYVPVDKRYSAALSYAWHRRAWFAHHPNRLSWQESQL